MRFMSTVLLVSSLSLSLAAAEQPAELRSILAKADAANEVAKRDFHLAQAKAKEVGVKEMEKLLTQEKKKKNSPLVEPLESYLSLWKREVTELKDETFMRAKEIAGALERGSYSAADWDALTGTMLTIEAKAEWTDAKTKVEPGELWLVVPNPDDKWAAGGGMGGVDWRGTKEGAMRLNFKLNETVTSGPFIEGTGRLYLGPNDQKDFSDNSGSMRVKLIRVR